ncbi:ferredoxin [Streptomyces sp. NPDC093544]|jgi:ferredoxin|uniref:ferredoxin n=1 Tax=Streptomyces sp. NPDC093544 TaxID=3155200 RepID=UPI003418B2F9
MSDRWTVQVESAVCVGSGLCAGSAPHVFALDTAGRAVGPKGTVDASDDLMEAAENCPAAAIALRTTDGGEIFAP